MACFLLLTIVSAHFCFSIAFLSNADRVRTCRRFRAWSTVRGAAADACEDPGDDASDQDKDGGSRSFTALPPIGASSFWDPPREGSEQSGPREDNSNEGSVVGERAELVSAKFQLQYTCKICGTRNRHAVSRLAYRQGLVIAMCKGCESRHLIADNLGWCGFDANNGETDIESFMENRQREARGNDVGAEAEGHDLVKRVSRDVFELETLLHKGKEKDAVSVPRATQDDGPVEEESSWN